MKCLILDDEPIADLEAMKAQAEVEEQNKEIARRFVEALDEGNFAIHEELISEDYICHFAGNPEPLARETQKRHIQTYYEAFPDNKHLIEDIIAKNDKIILRQINRATHDKEFEGLPPSGDQVEYSGIWIFRISDGKIVESWGIEDYLSFWLQLGMELTPKENRK